MDDAKLYELHEKVKDAKVNGGFVTLAASELAELLPAQPVIVEAKPSEPAVGDNHQPATFAPAEPAADAPVTVDPPKPTVQ